MITVFVLVFRLFSLSPANSRKDAPGPHIPAFPGCVHPETDNCRFPFGELAGMAGARGWAEVYACALGRGLIGIGGVDIR